LQVIYLGLVRAHCQQENDAASIYQKNVLTPEDVLVPKREVLRKQLLQGEKSIGAWGTGYIGFSTMANYAVNGVRCIGTDISRDRVETINSGTLPVSNMQYWLGFDIGPLVRAGLIRATTNWKELLSKDVAVHFVAVPTEKEGKPQDEALLDVLYKIARIGELEFPQAPLVIIESTLTPKKTDELVLPAFEDKGLAVGKDILVGVAPRRDWFISPEKNLKTLPRIVGGTTKETTELMIEALSIVCDHLIRAADHKHAEMVKSIENAYRHVEITLANQLSLAYPRIDMTEVLRLVGTKWNIGTYHPSFGTGGYCIPLASQYVMAGADNPEYLSILERTIETDSRLPFIVAESIVKRGLGKVGILGLSYKGDLKIHTLSPTVRIAKLLQEEGVSVKVNDPYYTSHEVQDILGIEAFEFPEGMGEFDAILVVAGHRRYRAVPDSAILNNLTNCRLVLDNVEETWKDLNLKEYGIEYHAAGDAGWLG
jgi:nucleotide sugar dehydrogenase